MTNIKLYTVLRTAPNGETTFFKIWGAGATWMPSMEDTTWMDKTQAQEIARNASQHLPGFGVQIWKRDRHGRLQTGIMF